MLEYLRKNSKSFLIVFCVIALVIVFVINFGSQAVGWRATPQKKIVLATVYGHDITESEFVYEMRLLKSRFRFREEFIESEMFRKTLLNGLVERELLMKVAEELGLKLDEEMVFDEIVDNLNIYFAWPSEDLPIIRIPSKLYDFVDENGKFLHEEFEAFIGHLGLGLKGFVEEQKRDMLAHFVREIVMNNVEVSPIELKDTYWRRNTKVNIKFVKLLPQYFSDRMEPSQEELSKWIDSHKKEIEEYYNANLFKYKNLPEEVRVRHIFVKVPEDIDDAQKLELRAKAERILSLVSAGADFSLLARCYSDDEFTKYSGGDLGYVRKGVGEWGDRFYEELLKIEPGKIEGPIESEKGFHIVKLIDKRKGDISLEDAKLEIGETLYRKEKGEEVAKKVGEKLLERLKKGEELNEQLLSSIEELQLQICPLLESNFTGKVNPEESAIPKESPSRLAPNLLETGMFSMVDYIIPNIGDSPEIRKIAFSLTRESPIPKELVRFRDSFIVLKLIDREDPTEEGFEKDKESLYNELLSQKRYSTVVSFIKRLREEGEKEGKVVVYEERILGKKEETKEEEQGREKGKVPPSGLP